MDEYSRLESLIASKSEQIRKLDRLITSVSGHCSPECLSNVKNDLENDVIRFAGIQRSVSDAIDSLDSPDCIDVLTLRYINGLSMRDIAVETGYSERNVWRIHDQAIDRLQVVMDCQFQSSGE